MTDPFDATPESVEEWERAMQITEGIRRRTAAREVKERLDLQLRREAEARTARADGLPGSFAVDLTARRRPEAWSAYAEELLAEGLRELAAEDLERAAEYEGKPKSTGKRTGARRDKEIALLRDRVSALEGVVDQMAAALSSLKRHVQFHPADAEERMWIYGCDACDPSAEARMTERVVQNEARTAEGVWPYNHMSDNPTEG
jgi:hypothetical protein